MVPAGLEGPQGAFPGADADWAPADFPGHGGWLQDRLRSSRGPSVRPRGHAPRGAVGYPDSAEPRSRFSWNSPARSSSRGLPPPTSAALDQRALLTPRMRARGSARTNKSPWEPRGQRGEGRTLACFRRLTNKTAGANYSAFDLSTTLLDSHRRCIFGERMDPAAREG